MSSDIRIDDLSVKEFINCFSLLVVFGSVSTAYFFGALYHANLSYSFYWLLGTTVWIIYSLDHILDGLKMGSHSTSVRHRIHYEYRKPLLSILTGLALFNAYLAFSFLPKIVWQLGLGTAGLVVVYFAFVHVLKLTIANWTKELVVAFVVAIGMMLLPGAVGDLGFSFTGALMFIFLTSLNYINLLLFSYNDYDSDIANGLKSAATSWGKEKTYQIILYTFGVAFMSFLLWTFSLNTVNKLPASVAMLVMLNVLLVIYIQEDRFAEKESYRFWGDFIYLIPGLVWYLLGERQFF